MTWEITLCITNTPVCLLCVSFFMYAAAKSIQSCPTLCDSVDCSPPGSSVREAYNFVFLAVLDFPVGAASRGFLFQWLLFSWSTSFGAWVGEFAGSRTRAQYFERLGLAVSVPGLRAGLIVAPHMWGLPRPGIEPTSPALAGRSFTPAPTKPRVSPLLSHSRHFWQHACGVLPHTALSSDLIWHHLGFLQLTSVQTQSPGRRHRIRRGRAPPPETASPSTAGANQVPAPPTPQVWLIH